MASWVDELDGPGPHLQREVVDKYAMRPGEAAAPDCAPRLPICRGACCALRFPLSRQDIDEGVVRFDPDEPYLNAVDEDGHCLHKDVVTKLCDVYEQRPAPCRAFDCRNDHRIWVDYEAMVLNPLLQMQLDAQDETRARKAAREQPR